MDLKENLFKEKNYTKSYLEQINRDWWILKGQLIFGGVFLAAGMVYLILG